MKVIDKTTGNILESDNEIVCESWANAPDRYTTATDARPKRNKHQTEEEGDA